MISLSSASRALAAVKSARDVTFAAYFLHPGAMERALEDAAERGAHVTVRLEGRMWKASREMHDDNAAAAARMRHAGADVKLVHRTKGDGPALHMKAAVCDGVAFLDDCNWNGSGDTIVRDDNPAHARAIRDVVKRQGGEGMGRLSLDKRDALGAEVRVLERSAHGVDLETEELHGRGAIVSGALRRLVERGVHCRVLVSEQMMRSDRQTRKAVESLENAGVEIRAARSSEKFAVCERTAWIGSADATSSFLDPDQIEWSVHVNDGRIVRSLQRRFDQRWNESSPASAT